MPYPRELPWDVWAPVDYRLPAAALVEGGAVSHVYRAMGVGQWSAAYGVTVLDASTRVLGRAWSEVGASLREVDALGQAADALRDVANAPAGRWEAAARGLAVQVGTLAAREVLAEVVGRWPVVGWVARLGALVWEGVERLRRAAEREPPPPSVRVLAYDEQADRDTLRVLVDRAQADDWTDDYAPPDGPVVATRAVDGWGTPRVILSTVGGGGVGHVPGGGWVGYLDLPTAGLSPHPTLRTLLPATAGLADARWSAMLAGGVVGYRADAAALVERWRGARLQWQAQWSSHTSPQLAALDERDPGPSQWMREQGLRVGAIGLVDPVVRSDELAQRQRAWLATLTVAYLRGDEPGLRGLAAELTEHRRELLTHPSRYAVELDRVPEGQWRTALWRSRIAAPVGWTAAARAAMPTLGGQLRFASLAPALERAAARPVSAPALPRRGGAGGALLVAALLAGVAR